MFVPISQHVVADRYELIEEIGRGSMGVIWRARQTNLGIECAIKFIHAAQAHDPDLRRRFVREARAAASLKSPHSVHILDVDEWQGCLFIAMELLIGETLEARLERLGRLSPEATLEIVEQVARGLNKAHAARLVHRDLKPDNIFLVDDDPMLVKILDFGIAKRLDAIAGLQTASGALLGTPGYMSPEQALASKNIDFRSDLWSLAVVVFRCLTGVEPFDGDGLGQILVEIVKGPLKKPSSVNPHLPVSVDEWWLRATQREPSARHESATALVNDLRRALESQPVWPASAFEPTLAGSDFPVDPPATLEPMLAAQRNSSPAAMRYSVAMVPALIVSGWFIGRALWSPTVGAWRTERAQQNAPSVSFAVAPVTAVEAPPEAMPPPLNVTAKDTPAESAPVEDAPESAAAGAAGAAAPNPTGATEEAEAAAPAPIAPGEPPSPTSFMEASPAGSPPQVVSPTAARDARDVDPSEGAAPGTPRSPGRVSAPPRGAGGANAGRANASGASVSGGRAGAGGVNGGGASAGGGRAGAGGARATGAGGGSAQPARRARARVSAEERWEREGRMPEVSGSDDDGLRTRRDDEADGER